MKYARDLSKILASVIVYGAKGEPSVWVFVGGDGKLLDGTRNPTAKSNQGSEMSHPRLSLVEIETLRPAASPPLLAPPERRLRR